MTVRSGLHFRLDGQVVEVSLGSFGGPESEQVLSLHLSFVPALIAGLLAIQQPPRRKKAT